MAFGIQKKVYKTRPRKPYSKRRKSSFDTVPKHCRDFKSQPSKNNDPYHIGIVFIILVISVLSTIIPRWSDYERMRHKQEVTYATVKDTKAYRFLKKSGEKRLMAENYVGALSEFKLAQKIRPNSEEINQLLLEVITILCEKDNSYCKEYETLQL